MATQDNWQNEVWHGSTTGAPPSPTPPGMAPVTVMAPPVQPAAPAQKSKAWIVALVAVVLFFLLIVIGMVSCSNMMNASLNSVSLLGTTSAPQAAVRESVGIIEITGTIQYDGTTSSPEGLKAQLDRAENDPLIKAVVLRVDSGGGTSTAGEEMSLYVRDFSKPIVVSSAASNASAAYEISSQADYIFVNETTMIGAIGTIMQVADISGLLDMLGIKMDSIVSADSKDASFGYRPLTEEEKAHYQDLVNQINQTFIDKVAEGRGMSVEDVTKLANGMSYTGIDAVDNGLADEIGLLDDAVAKAASLAGIDNPDTLYLRPKTTIQLRDLIGLLSESADDPSDLDLGGDLTREQLDELVDTLATDGAE